MICYTGGGGGGGVGVTGNYIATFVIIVIVNTGTSLVQCSIVWNTSRE